MHTRADLIRYDIRKDRHGWTVYDVRTGRTAIIDEVLQVGLDMDEADTIADALSAGADDARAPLAAWAGWGALPAGLTSARSARSRQP
ncbi:hypothetical protein OPKNFCMD_1648 [Methylobacterium crusticola]|uniref:Uncharacterized protein n=1 Tax=Methylobacterium crusticola TaxID=1697972 RepID=A0ABQ4QWG1_9HYPH|nr:hypothetical protein [Methylobacterium crusticola]GJD48922.1 hypothetical protein OPKNFCMD_1648 [Methylobacterium crusticola]